MTPNSFLPSQKKPIYTLWAIIRFHYKEEVKGTFLGYQMKQQGLFSAPQSP